MRLFLLSLLAIGSVQAYSIAYPAGNQQALFAYRSRAEFPVQSSHVKGFLRYIDANGLERIVEYKYPEPLYAIRSKYYAPASQQPTVLKYQLHYGIQDEVAELQKASEPHFRAWVLQQYQALKFEIDSLQVAGKQPSPDMLQKFRPLERIALTADYASIAELPEIKQLHEIHSRLWNEAHLRSIQHETVKYDAYQQQQQQQPVVHHIHHPQGEIKTYAVVKNVPAHSIQETAAAAQKQTVFNTQSEHLKTLQTQDTVKAQQQQQQYADGLTEVERATREHLRLWNEAKLRAEQASESDQQHGAQHETANKQMISEHLKYDQSVHNQHQAQQQQQQSVVESFSSLRGSFAEAQQPAALGQPVVVDTPEVAKAREEHLRLVNEANLKVQAAEQHKSQSQQQTQEQSPLFDYLKQQQQNLKHSSEHQQHDQTIHQQQQQQQQQTLKQSSEHQQQDQTIHQQQHFSSQKAYLPEAQQETFVQQHVADTPEVAKAREEHFRLVNEAKLKVEAAQQHKQQIEQQVKQHSQLKTDFQQEHNVKQANEYQQQQQQSVVQFSSVRASFPESQQHTVVDQQQQHTVAENQQQQIADTPEVAKAREEHLRLVNEAKLKVQAAEQHKHQIEQQVQQHSQLKTDFQQQHSSNQASFVHSVGQQQQQQQVADTAEVIKAREEHLRLVNEAKIRVQAAEALKGQAFVIEPSNKQQQEQQQQQQQQQQQHQQYAEQFSSVRGSFPEQQPHAVVHQQSVVDTPEVAKARAEHLRLVNEANLKAQSAEQHNIQANQQQSHGQSQLKSEFQQVSYAQTAEHAIADTPEVVKARQEHLRLVNEAKLKVQAAEQLQSQVQQQQLQSQQAANPSFESRFNLESNSEQNSADYSKHLSEKQQLKSVAATNQQQQNSFVAQPVVVDTPEVIKAREEHLRLVSEAQQRAQSVEQEEFKYKNIPQIPVLKSVEQQSSQAIQDTAEVIKAREEHLRVVNELKSHAQQQEAVAAPHGQQQAVQQQSTNSIYALKNLQPVSDFNIHASETAEVQKAREEHLKIFNSIKAHVEQEQSKVAEVRSSGLAKLDISESEVADEILDEYNRIREQQLLEQQRLEKERMQLQIEQTMEAERLAREQQEMEAELIRLRMEEEQRLQIEKQQEFKYLKGEQQQDFTEQQRKKTEEYQIVGQTEGQQADGQIEVQSLQPQLYQQPIFSKTVVQSGVQQQQIIENPSFATRFGEISAHDVAAAAQFQQNQQYTNNPFLRANPIASNVVFNQQQKQQNYVSNPFLKSVASKESSAPHTQAVPVISSAQSAQSSAAARYVQQSSSSQQTTANQHQYNNKNTNDYIKTSYSQGGATSYQPADTAVVFDQLEQARQEHFRAHDLVLERLRLARLQDASLKDCN